MDKVRIERTLKRIAYQILEHCYQEKEITLIGIEPRGVWVSDQLTQWIKEISPMKVAQLKFNSERPEDVESMDAMIKGRCVILVDDVIKSGLTMMQAASAITAHQPRYLITASLVDRKHRRFPIQCDFTGLSLATTIQEHIQLVIEPNPVIYLE